MLLVREIFHCKPGRVRPLVEKFQAMSKLAERAGLPPVRVLTDFSGERYWTVIAEMETDSLDAFERMMRGEGQDRRAMKEMEKIMKDYHELVESGRREILNIEA